jgi:hypothetical protein
MEDKLAISPTNNAALLQEVDEAVRKDEINAFISRYGRWLAGAVLAGLLAFAGYLYWNHHKNEVAGQEAEKFSAVLDQLAAGQNAEAAKGLDAIIADGPTAYRAAATLQKANAAAADGKLAEAAKLLAGIAADSKVDQGLRDLALVRQTALEFDTLKPEAVIARMQPIVSAKDPQSSWFASAAELTAIAHYQLGQLDKAGALFGQIAKLEGVSPSLKSRATQMAGMLGVDAVTDAADQDKNSAPAGATAEDSK